MHRASIEKRGLCWGGLAVTAAGGEWKACTSSPYPVRLSRPPCWPSEQHDPTHPLGGKQHRSHCLSIWESLKDQFPHEGFEPQEQMYTPTGGTQSSHWPCRCLKEGTGQVGLQAQLVLVLLWLWGNVKPTFLPSQYQDPRHPPWLLDKGQAYLLLKALEHSRLVAPTGVYSWVHLVFWTIKWIMIHVRYFFPLSWPKP